MNPEQFERANSRHTPDRLNGARVTMPRIYVPVTHAEERDYEQAHLGMQVVLDTLWSGWDPSCSVTFVVQVAAGQIAMGFEISSATVANARDCAEFVRHAAASAVPWLGLGEPQRRRPWRRPGTVYSTFESDSSGESALVSVGALPWRSLSSVRGTWHLTTQLVCPGGPDLAASTQAGTVDPFAVVTLHGKGKSGNALRSLIAADRCAQAKLVPLSRQSQAPIATAIPQTLLAHLLAAPARVGDEISRVRKTDPQVLFDRVEAAPTPHVLLVGASGQGKSTTLTALASRSAASGDALVAIDIHDGDSVHRLRSELDRLDRPYLFVDLSDLDAADLPAIRYSEPPLGVSADRHVEELWGLLRNDLWGAMPDDFFGPVGEDITRICLEIAVKDPTREFGLGDIGRFISPNERQYRDAVLTRLAIPSLTQAVQSRIVPMVMAKDAGNSCSWIASKFGPFASPVINRIVEGKSNRVPIEQAIERGYSLLVHAPSAQLGDAPSRLIVGIVISRVYGAMRRSPEPKKVTFVLDEFQRYASRLTVTMLSESRKFGARLLLANQNLSQLDQSLRETVLANTGAIGCFRTSPFDAAALDGVFPTVTTRTMQTLPAHTLALTTFSADLVAKGPGPLPDASSNPEPWGSAIRRFWNGEEPQPLIDVYAGASDVAERAIDPPSDEPFVDLIDSFLNQVGR